MTPAPNQSEANEKFAKSVTIDGITVPDVSVNMIRAPFTEAPLQASEGSGQFMLPQNYKLRLYRAGDRENWTAIQRAAETFFVIDDELFDRQFGTQIAALSKRMYFIDWIDEAEQSTAVGTATAWWKDSWKLPHHSENSTTADHDNTIDLGAWGQVHWVAIHPDHQGIGLSKPLMYQVLSTIAEHDDRTMLGTSTGRIWALKVYLDLGFKPEPFELKNAEVMDAWQALNQVLNHPFLSASLQSYG